MAYPTVTIENSLYRVDLSKTDVLTVTFKKVVAGGQPDYNTSLFYRVSENTATDVTPNAQMVGTQYYNEPPSFIAQSGTVSLPLGTYSKSITIRLIKGAAVTLNTAFLVTITSASNGVLGTPKQAVVQFIATPVVQAPIEEVPEVTNVSLPALYSESPPDKATYEEYLQTGSSIGAVSGTIFVANGTMINLSTLTGGRQPIGTSADYVFQSPPPPSTNYQDNVIATINKYTEPTPIMAVSLPIVVQRLTYIDTDPLYNSGDGDTIFVDDGWQNWTPALDPYKTHNIRFDSFYWGVVTETPGGGTYSSVLFTGSRYVNLYPNPLKIETPATIETISFDLTVGAEQVYAPSFDVTTNYWSSKTMNMVPGPVGLYLLAGTMHRCTVNFLDVGAAIGLSVPAAGGNDVYLDIRANSVSSTWLISNITHGV